MTSDPTAFEAGLLLGMVVMGVWLTLLNWLMLRNLSLCPKEPAETTEHLEFGEQTDDR